MDTTEQKKPTTLVWVLLALCVVGFIILMIVAGKSDVGFKEFVSDPQKGLVPIILLPVLVAVLMGV